MHAQIKKRKPHAMLSTGVTHSAFASIRSPAQNYIFIVFITSIKETIMANTFNKTILIGRLGRDPELFHSDKTDYVHFSICNSSFKDGQETVQFHNICAFGNQARLCHEYLHKGDLCCIEGRLDSSFYEKDGVRKHSQSVIAEHITFLPSRRQTQPPADEAPAEPAANDAVPF